MTPYMALGVSKGSAADFAAGMLRGARTPKAQVYITVLHERPGAAAGATATSVADS